MHLRHKIFTTLTKGLGDRVQLIVLATNSLPCWSVKSSKPTNSLNSGVDVRFLLDPVNSGRTVEHGPSAENKQEAAAFRTFWGEKAELRRFKDGSILESLIWPSNLSESSITQLIVSYLLGRHVSPKIDGLITYINESFADLLHERSMSSQQALSLFQPPMTAYNEMEASIRRLEGMPLQLRQISGVSSVLRNTSVFPPLSARRLSSDALQVVVQFEGSGRWPDDLVAIQRTKIAILLKMSQLLNMSTQSVTTRLGLENQEYSTLNTAFLDVVRKDDGLAFRLRIQNEREQTLNERRLKDKTLGLQGREEAALALAEYKRNFVHAPLHTQTVRILCTRYPLLSQTIRLTKRWFASHLLSPHFAEELVEIFVIRIFVQPYPWQAPSSLRSGFLRTLLFLSRWDWRVEPLIVNISGELSLTDKESITTNFEAWRKIDPGLNRVVLFAASNLDLDGVTWTQKGPSKVVAARMTALARAACTAAQEAGFDLDADVRRYLASHDSLISCL